MDRLPKLPDQQSRRQSPWFPTMTGWYDPLQLLRTGIQVAISTIFSENADYRQIEALGSPEDPEPEFKAPDGKSDFWVDIACDVGDGWNSTYSIASAIAQPELRLRDPSSNQEISTRRGQVLIFGGDEVYPLSSRDAYQEKLVRPYRTALCHTLPGQHPHLYAIPGNHDWYDSLVSFTRLFCTGRWIGGWKTCQKRSYFVLGLPHGWWIVGSDIQLNSDIDEPQIQYLRQRLLHLPKNDRIILCTAEPHWIYNHLYRKNERSEPNEYDAAFRKSNLHFLEEQIGRRISVYVSGDLHHYRRHEAPDGRQKITAGGGGAFLHPTHGPDVSLLEEDFGLKASFPDASTSRKLTYRNLLFPLLNPKFLIVPAILYTIAAWAATRTLGSTGWDHCGSALGHVVRFSLETPLAVLWWALLFAAFWLFTDTHRPAYRIVGGSLHALAHTAAAFFLGWGAAAAAGQVFGPDPERWKNILGSLMLLFLSGGVAGGVIVGVYLLVSLNVFGVHVTEAFSSLRCEDWKNFLRLRIGPDGVLTIFPIGIRRVGKKWSQEGGQYQPCASQDRAATPPALIEAPIQVKHRAVELPAAKPDCTCQSRD